MIKCFRYVVLSLIGAYSVLAQVSTGTITGYVHDASEAAIVGAKVSILETQTGERRETVTNDRGEFNAPYLQRGTYSVSVSATGFKTEQFTTITLAVDQTLRLPVTLEPGAVQQSVEVTAAAPMLDSVTSSLGQIIDNKEIIDMPLNGRDVWTLGLLSGNSAPVKGVASNLPFVAGGGRFQNNDILLDGIDNNTTATAGGIGVTGINYTPSVDAIFEFKIKTNNYSAEFGRSAGTIVSATTKSGTNTVSGDCWEFLRNDAMDSNNFFSNVAGTPKQPYKQNQFGCTLGGPIVVPKVYNGRNKTFFFTDYEGLRRATSASSTIEDIPPDSFRSGNFSSYAYPIYDPASRQLAANGTVVSTPFPNNQIPMSRLNAGAVATLQLLPQPNFGSAAAQSRNYLFSGSQPFDSDQFDVRIDHQFSEKNTLFGRISRALQSNTSPGNFNGFLGGGTDGINNSVSATLNDVNVFANNIVNEARFGYSRHNGNQEPLDESQGVSFASQNGIAMYPFPVLAFPQILFSSSGQNTGGTNEFQVIGSATPNLNIENLFEGADDLSWNKGSHSMKFGADFRRDRFDTVYGGGETVFGPIFTSSSNSPNSGAPLADFLLGDPAQLTGTQLLDWARLRDIYAGVYFQDDWKVTSRLTVNMGLRYELFTQPVDAKNKGALFDAATGEFVIPGQSGYSDAIVKGHHLDFAPRLGFAYSPSSRLTVRGGSGVFYGPRSPNQQSTVFGANPPNAPTVITPSVSATSTLAPPISLGTPIQVGPQSPNLSTFTPQNTLGLLIRTADFSNSRPAQLYEWNLGFQYQAAKSLVLQATYSAERGNHLTSRVNLNQIPWAVGMAGCTTQACRLFPNVGNQVVMDSSAGNNFYNALNLRAEKRLSAGVNFLVNYTWSKNLEANGTGGNSSFSQNGGTTNPLDSWNLHKEKSYAPLDLPNVFVASAGYELPFGAGKHWVHQPGFFSAVLGGWAANGILTLESGFPTDIRTPNTSSGQLFTTYNLPNVVQGQSLYLPNPSPNGWFNPAAFTEPGQAINAVGTPITEFGNLARRAGRGPGTRNLDFSVFRNFAIREHVRLQFRAEAFNLSNTPAFFLPAANSPELTIGNPSFGLLAASSAVARQIQFGLKLYF
jgi:hypothetical protein